MTREEIREGMKELLTEDLINLNVTHENPPPGKDCGEECEVSLVDQIASANPVVSPMRSGGKKHKRCMDCWNEYIDGLILRLLTKQSSQGVAIKVEMEYPDFPSPTEEDEEIAHCCQWFDRDWYSAGQSNAHEIMLKVGYAAVEPLVEGE